MSINDVLKVYKQIKNPSAGIKRQSQRILHIYGSVNHRCENVFSLFIVTFSFLTFKIFL